MMVPELNTIAVRKCRASVMRTVESTPVRVTLADHSSVSSLRKENQPIPGEVTSTPFFVVLSPGVRAVPERVNPVSMPVSQSTSTGSTPLSESTLVIPLSPVHASQLKMSTKSTRASEQFAVPTVADSSVRTRASSPTLVSSNAPTENWTHLQTRSDVLVALQMPICSQPSVAPFQKTLPSPTWTNCQFSALPQK